MHRRRRGLTAVFATVLFGAAVGCSAQAAVPTDATAASPVASDAPPAPITSATDFATEVLPFDLEGSPTGVVVTDAGVYVTDLGAGNTFEAGGFQTPGGQGRILLLENGSTT